MKNIFSATVVTLLALSLSAYAQYEGDSYGEYPEYSNGGSDVVSVPAPTSTEVSTIYTPSYTPMSSSSSSSNPDSFNGQFFRFGGRIFLGYSDFWNVDDRYDKMYDPDHNKVANPYDELSGFNVGAGVVGNFRINDVFSIMPEVVFAFTDYSEVLDSYYYWGYGTVDLEHAWTMINIDIDPVFRFMPVGFFYLELGARLSINLYAEESLSLRDYSSGKIVDSGAIDWDTCNSFLPGVIFGFGFSVEGLKHRHDLGLRFALDFTSIEDSRSYYYDVQGGEHSFKTSVRRFEIQIVYNQWWI